MALGVGATVWLGAATNLGSVIHASSDIGYGATIVVAVRAMVIGLNGAAWARLVKSLVTIPERAFIVARWIREAVDVLLPVANVGGAVVGGRVLTFWGVSRPMAFAGVTADLLLQTTAQFLFSFIGAMLLFHITKYYAIFPAVVIGFAIAGILLSGFYGAQRYGGARLVDRTVALVSARIGWKSPVEPGFQVEMERIWSDRKSPITLALFVHFIAWSLGTFEVYVTLYFLRFPISFEHAIVLESLAVSISLAGFAIPGSWGIQEAGYIFIGQLLGVPPSLALTLSLVKRIPDFALGVPGLVAWQILEARHRVSVGAPI